MLYLSEVTEWSKLRQVTEVKTKTKTGTKMNTNSIYDQHSLYWLDWLDVLYIDMLEKN